MLYRNKIGEFVFKFPIIFIKYVLYNNRVNNMLRNNALFIVNSGSILNGI